MLCDIFIYGVLHVTQFIIINTMEMPWIMPVLINA